MQATEREMTEELNKKSGISPVIFFSFIFPFLPSVHVSIPVQCSPYLILPTLRCVTMVKPIFLAQDCFRDCHMTLSVPISTKEQLAVDCGKSISSLSWEFSSLPLHVVTWPSNPAVISHLA